MVSEKSVGHLTSVHCLQKVELKECMLLREVHESQLKCVKCPARGLAYSEHALCLLLLPFSSRCSLLSCSNYNKGTQVYWELPQKILDLVLEPRDGSWKRTIY